MIVKRLDESGETWHSPTARRPNGYCESCDIPYLVIGATSRAAAIAAVMAEAPDEYEGTDLAQVRFDDWNGDGAATVTAVYNRETHSDQEDDDEEPTMSYDCGGGTKHMVHAYEQQRVYGGTIDDAACMIGWNGKSGTEAEYAGVDVPCADMRITYKKLMRVSKLTSTSYMKSVAHVVGMVNNDTFKGWAPGELMFLGCTYETPMKGNEKVMASYHFRAMPNEKDCVVAGKNVGSKKGFEYMWARSETVANGETGQAENKVAGIYKSKVCLYTNFHNLGI